MTFPSSENDTPGPEGSCKGRWSSSFCASRPDWADPATLVLLLGSVPFAVANVTEQGSGVSTKDIQAQSCILTRNRNGQLYWGGI